MGLRLTGYLRRHIYWWSQWQTWMWSWRSECIHVGPLALHQDRPNSQLQRERKGRMNMERICVSPWKTSCYCSPLFLSACYSLFECVCVLSLRHVFIIQCGDSLHIVTWEDSPPFTFNPQNLVPTRLITWFRVKTSFIFYFILFYCVTLHP